MRSALVTGAARGLGLALCRELLNRGYSVYALVRKISAELKALQTAGLPLHILIADVTDMVSLHKAAHSIGTESLDILINNAGIWLDQERHSLESEGFDPELVLKQLDVNAAGVVRSTSAFLPMLLAGKEKLLINISSEAGSITACCRSEEYGYCMSKAAANMATKLMHNELQGKGVRLLAVHPGWMVTDMGMAGASALYRPDQDPVESARLILDMAADSSRTGLFYQIDGTPLPW